ncbi:hypothetical protein H072_1759 [Dactylellina haptotyla CBS 200.50]|uniref:tyrosinase n=1 Tax=Dactylellina haptotyla (strain CBS 200.50) TaxID=1284197 RepID=S8BXK9_DACHA|nr:hypothetical protein H072_1759 [Dactylellina haptotyla CBS 200.50]
MDKKSYTETPRARRPTMRCTSVSAISLCIILFLAGFGKLIASSGLLWTERLPEFLYPLGVDQDSILASAADLPGDICDDEENILEKRQSGFFIVTGINNNGVQLRQEWNTFAADADLLNLFLCGLEAMQAKDQNARDSFFQISGIHGGPYVPWDGVDGPNTGSGYCTHASILFPTWHRPYLAAYEQILGGIMVNLANQYPAGQVRNRYVAAASKFRLPYWDWASNGQVPDIIGNQPRVSVEKPQGFVQINNPLYTYIFHPFSPSYFPYAPFNAWTRTLRQPDGNGNSNPGEVNRQMAANQASLRNRVFNILNYQNQYNVFSNKAWNGGNSGNQDSIESIHDLVHGIVGGNGHMAVVDTSSHDPIFMLHHCNVYVNPNAFTTSQTAIFGTRTTTSGTIEDANSELKPFHRTQSAYWTSAQVRDHKVFGYNYPELADVGTVPDYRLRSRLRTRIQDLYGSSAPQSTLREGGSASKRSLTGRAGNTIQLAQHGKYHEWTTNVRINKYVTIGSYLVNMYIGEPTKGVEWSDDPNFVGSYYIFSKRGNCHGCSPNSHVTGSVPLTNALIESAKQGKIQDLTPESVIPYLRDNLTWRVQWTDGGFLNPSDVKSLKVSVSAAEVTIPTALSQGAVIGNWTTYYEITSKKPAGLLDDADTT